MNDDQKKRLLKAILVASLILVGVVFSMLFSYVIFPENHTTSLRIGAYIITAVITALGVGVLFLISWAFTGTYGYVVYGEGFTIFGLIKAIKKDKARRAKSEAKLRPIVNLEEDRF
jgi:uncharacterized BrkB/YihY/UPF0761 family membrane protein